MANYTWSTPTQLKNCLNPSLAQDAATKSYVDNAIANSGGGGGNYGNANVANYLPTFTGNVGAGNVNLVGSGDLLLTATGNINLIPDTGNIIATGNVSANYFLGNGSFLTGIAISNIANVLIINARENVSLVGANTTVTFDVLTSAVQYQTAAAIATTTVNFRGNSTQTLNSMLSVGQSITVTYVMTTTATGYAVSTVQVDGVTQTVKYPDSAVPTAAVNATTAYTYTIIKTASTPTYIVLGSQTRYQ